MSFDVSTAEVGVEVERVLFECVGRLEISKENLERENFMKEEKRENVLCGGICCVNKNFLFALELKKKSMVNFNFKYLLKVFFVKNEL